MQGQPGLRQQPLAIGNPVLAGALSQHLLRPLDDVTLDLACERVIRDPMLHDPFHQRREQQAWMIRWPVHWSVKYALILAITMSLLLASYHCLVRSTFVGQFLNGRKYPRAGTVTTSTPSISPG